MGRLLSPFFSSFSFRPPIEAWIALLLPLLAAHRDPGFRGVFSGEGRWERFLGFVVWVVWQVASLHSQAPVQKRVFVPLVSRLFAPLILSLRLSFSCGEGRLFEALRALLREVLFNKEQLAEISHSLPHARSFFLGLGKPANEPDSAEIEEQKEEREEQKGGKKPPLAYQRVLFEEFTRITFEGSSEERSALFYFLPLYFEEFLSQYASFRREKEKRTKAQLGVNIEFQLFVEILATVGFNNPTSSSTSSLSEFSDFKPISLLNQLLEQLFQSGIHQVTNEARSKAEGNYLAKLLNDVLPLLQATPSSPSSSHLLSQLCLSFKFFLSLNQTLLEPHFPDIFPFLLTLEPCAEKVAFETSLFSTYGRLRQLDFLLSSLFTSLSSQNQNQAFNAQRKLVPWSSQVMETFASLVRNLPQGQIVPIFEEFLGELKSNHSRPHQDPSLPTPPSKKKKTHLPSVENLRSKLSTTPFLLITDLFTCFIDNVRVVPTQEKKFDEAVEGFWSSFLSPSLFPQDEDEEKSPLTPSRKRKSPSPPSLSSDHWIHPLLETHHSLCLSFSSYSERFFSLQSLEKLREAVQGQPKPVSPHNCRTFFSLFKLGLLWTKLAAKKVVNDKEEPIGRGILFSLSMSLPFLDEPSLGCWDGALASLDPNSLQIAFWESLIMNFSSVSYYADDSSFQLLVQIPFYFFILFLLFFFVVRLYFGFHLIGHA